MASCILPKSRFLHFPKTGGWWVCQVLRAAGVPIQHADTSNAGGHLGYDFGDLSRPAFGFVRNPYDWYQSLYCFLVSTQWRFHGDAQSSSLEEFVTRVLDDSTSVRPLSKWIRDFYGSEGEVSFIGRFETLCDDLILALQHCDETFDEPAIRQLSTKRVNTTSLARPPLSALAADLIRTHDADVFERFSYSMEYPYDT